MSLLRAAVCVLTVVLLSSSTALGQVESTPIPSTPKPDFSKMTFLTGNWSCSVKSSRRATAFQTTSSATLSPDGYWLITKTTTHKTAWMGRDLIGEDRMTYDPSTSRWIDVSYDNGGGYNVSVSPGWSGNSITWTDVVITKTNATASTNPTTLTKVSDTKTTSKNTFKEPSGRLVTVTSTCTKSS